MDAKYTILLVQRDVQDVSRLKDAFALAHLQNDVQVVANSRLAIDYLEGKPPYDARETFPLPWLLVVDLTAEAEPGIDLIEWKNQQPHFSRMLTIVLAARATSEQIERAYELGVHSCLTKPVSFEELAELVRHLSIYWK